MSVATRIENISNNLENAYNSLEGLGINLNDVNKNIENLSGVIDDIYNEWPKTSDEDTELKFDATKEGRINFELKGQTIQSKTTGKNLLKITPPTDAGYKKGIDTTYDNTTGEIKISGTTTNSYPWLSDSQVETIPSGTNLVFSTLILKSYKIYARLYASDETYETLTLNANTKQNTITTTKDIVRIGILTDTATGVTLNDSLYLQLEIGTSGTNYEPYTAKQVAPNPDYPQDIKIVNHKNIIQVIGKNLFDKNNVNFLSCWPTGTELASGNNMCYWIKCSPNTTYSVQKIMIVPNSQNRMAIATTETKPVLYTPVIDRINLGNDKTEGTITTSSRAHYLLIIVANTDSQPETTEEQILNSIQIEKNNAPTTYEEYKSQTYPINLGTKNLFNLATYQQLVQNNDYYRGEYSFENDSLTITTTTNDSYIPKMANISAFQDHHGAVIEVKPNTTYTFSFETSGDIPYGKYYIYEGNASYQGVKTTINALFSNKKSIFTTGDTTKYIIIRFAIWESATITFSRLQLEEGDIQHEYTKYGAQILELCQIDNYEDEIFKGTGKNLFKPFSYNRTSGGITWTYSNNGILTATGTSTGATSILLGDVISNHYYQKLTKGTYTISGGLAQNRRLEVRDLTGTTLAYTTANNDHATFTLTEDTNIYICGIISSGVTVNNLELKIQIEKNSEVTNYEPYNAKGKWYNTKKIGKVILDGNNTGLTYANNTLFYLANNYLKNSDGGRVLSTHYLGTANGGHTNVNLNAWAGNASTIAMQDNDKTSLQTWKNWLASNNNVCYYILENSIVTEITDSDLKAQLEQLYKAKSYNNITNITQENDNAPFIIKADALLQISD